MTFHSEICQFWNLCLARIISSTLQHQGLAVNVMRQFCGMAKIPGRGGHVAGFSPCRKSVARHSCGMGLRVGHSRGICGSATFCDRARIQRHGGPVRRTPALSQKISRDIFTAFRDIFVAFLRHGEPTLRMPRELPSLFPMILSEPRSSLHSPRELHPTPPRAGLRSFARPSWAL